MRYVPGEGVPEHSVGYWAVGRTGGSPLLLPGSPASLAIYDERPGSLHMSTGNEYLFDNVLDFLHRGRAAVNMAVLQRHDHTLGQPVGSADIASANRSCCLVNGEVDSFAVERHQCAIPLCNRFEYCLYHVMRLYLFDSSNRIRCTFWLQRKMGLATLVKRRQRKRT